MRIGIATFPTDYGIRPDTLARAVEERGFDSLFLAEHSHIPVGSALPDGSGLDRRYYRTLDPFVALTAAAATTRTLRLGTGVALLAQRDVIHTAKQVASLDLLSGGRVVLAVGTGWNRQEMRHHGTDPRTRGRVLDERIAALKEIWTHEVAEYHGEYVDFGPIQQWPKPVQRPHPPVYIGGHSPAALRRVFAHGDGWFPLDTSPEEFRRVRVELAAAGRDQVHLNAPGDPEDPAAVERYAQAGAHRAVFPLDVLPHDETLRRLDELSEATAAFRDGADG
ncbi:LLM class F420-dependent oxidoreductase [Streptomyces albus subsp. chlorinus]|uniref:LLM class F420-dependent oxidoreductase n=1 Tax=Streptomyces albus TaxID=1888 RepID=UPI0015703DAF|nr:LLM class F420-dependent oxidoreductase [Streptomyces albus]NSC20674.1 LLM class F420-dependent oxidoreductase [Streptomyces albus subsp. chlorinus]